MIYLSIIIPVYNSEKYLPRCLDSIVNQLKEGVELILVDDGSIDGSGNICDSYADNCEKIVVLHRSNGGVSNARNAGIDMAKGKYITFVDADDYVKDSFVDTMFREMVSNQDIFFFQHTSDIDVKERTSEIDVRHIDDNVSKDQIIKPIFTGVNEIGGHRYNFRTVWAKLIKREILLKNNTFFPEKVGLGEDIIFMLYVYSSIQTVKFVPVALYHYFFTNADSATNKYKPDLHDEIQRYIRAITPWLEQHPEYYPYHAYNELSDIITYMKMDFFHSDNRENNRDLKKRMKDIFADGMYNRFYKIAKENNMFRYCDFKVRVVYWLAIHKCFRSLKIIKYLKFGK